MTDKDRIDRLEMVVRKMAHYSGLSNRVLIDVGLEPYNPTKADMGPKFDMSQNMTPKKSKA